VVASSSDTKQFIFKPFCPFSGPAAGSENLSIQIAERKRVIEAAESFTGGHTNQDISKLLTLPP
jgi:hypothetical protein